MKVQIFKFFIYLFGSVFICNAQNLKKLKINTELNNQYLESRKSYYGILTSEELIVIKNAFENELHIKFTDDKAILINFFQYGTNCIEYGFESKFKEKAIDKGVKLSNRISKKYNALDFFIYTDDAINYELLTKRRKFILDSGYFQKSIFTLQENCSAFFILKPNGEFLKYYGEDYYSEVINFLKDDED